MLTVYAFWPASLVGIVLASQVTSNAVLWLHSRPWKMYNACVQYHV